MIGCCALSKCMSSGIVDFPKHSRAGLGSLAGAFLFRPARHAQGQRRVPQRPPPRRPAIATESRASRESPAGIPHDPRYGPGLSHSPRQIAPSWSSPESGGPSSAGWVKIGLWLHLSAKTEKMSL